MNGSSDVAPRILRPVPPSTAFIAGLFLTGLVALQAQVTAPTGEDAATVAKYDKNKNGVLDPDERAALRADESNASKDSGTITLSPFTVNTSKDNGFMAANAGTATNLGLDMKDVPAPYSIMTGEFIAALGITNIEEASQWVTNGNGVVDGNGRDVFNIVVLNGNRGATYSSGQERNYFLSAGQQDSYALERYEFGRGPNAALFNVGSNTALGGGFSATTKRARLDKAFETVNLTTGSWDYKRTTADVNYVLIPDKLAVRGNAVWFDRGGWRMREFEKTHGATLALTYKVAPKTEIRLDYANDVTARNNPQFTLFDAITGWDGVTTFDRPGSDAIFVNGAPTNAAGQTLTAAAGGFGTPQGVARQGGAHYVWSPASGATSIINYQNEAITRRGDDTATTPMLWNGELVTRGSGLPFGNGATAAAAPNSTQGNGEVNLLYQINLATDRFNRAIAGTGGKFQLPNKRFNDAVDAPEITSRMRDYGLTLSHQFTDNLFMDVAVNENDVHNRLFQGLNNTRTVKIDINRNLPNGAANPEFLQPFFEAPIQYRNFYINNRGARAALGYIANLGKWGNYTINATGAFNSRDTKQAFYVYSMATAADPRMWQGSDDQIFQRYYWNEATRSIDEGQIPNAVTKIDWGNGSAATPTVSNLTIHPRYVLNGWNDTLEKFNFGRIAVSGRYLDNKLVVLAATRFDTYRTITHAALPFGDLPITWDGNTQYFKPDAPSDWLNLTYVPVNAAGVPTSNTPILASNRPRVNPAVMPYTTNNNGVQVPNPLYTGIRFRDDYSNPDGKGSGATGSYGFVYHVLRFMDLSANYSSAFVPPPTGSFELNNNVVKPQTGKGYDMGLRFTLFEGKLSINTDYFFNQQDHVRSDPPWKGNANSLIARNSFTDAGADSVNSLGIAPITGTDYTSQKNHGVEIEAVGSIGRNLRLSLNIGTGKLINSKDNRWPLSQAYVAAHAADYLAILKQAGGMLDTSAAHPAHAPGLAVIDPTKPPAIVSERDGAITDYNALWANYEQLFTQQDQLAPLGVRTVVNAFADYAFSSGWAKGLKVGLGVQYRTKSLIGFRSADTIVGATGAAVDDPVFNASSPIYTKAPTVWSASVSYVRKLHGVTWFEGKELSLNLVLRNITNDQGIYYQDSDVVARPPDGANPVRTVNRVTVPVRNALYQQPMSFLLTAVVKF